jgi:4'-phosphopantetheinyl transferase
MDAFRQEADAHRFLLGKILLLKGMVMVGLHNFSLDHIRYNEYNKPYLPGEYNFNISHSGDYVVCAVSSDCKVGIDIEQVNDIATSDFLQCFTSNEWNHIRDSVHPVQTFYKLWTKKECIIKADGRGLQIPLLSFEVIDDTVSIEKKSWHIYTLKIADGYWAHLATNVRLTAEKEILVIKA